VTERLEHRKMKVQSICIGVDPPTCHRYDFSDGAIPPIAIVFFAGHPEKQFFIFFRQRVFPIKYTIVLVNRLSF